MTSAADWTLEVEHETPADVVAAIVQGLRDYNAENAPPSGAADFLVRATGAADGLAGGLVGAIYFQWLQIRYLWVHEEYRRRGVGRALLNAAEAEAATCGCVGAHVDTFSFQARGFYERHGYSVFGTLDAYPPGHSRYFLQKRLA